MCQLNINSSTLVNMNKRCYDLLEDKEQMILDYLMSNKVVHADETGIEVNTENYWMHVLSNLLATFLKIDKKRGAESFEKALYDYEGHIVHDFYSSYFKLNKAKHNMCGCHIDRECEALIEDKSEWAGEMKRLLLSLLSTTKQENIRCRDEIYIKYNDIIQKGKVYEPEPIQGKRGRPKKSKGLNLLERLQTNIDSVLEYAFDPDIPFANNQGERDLRHAKNKLKVSGCFRSELGAKYYARIIAYISTLKKNHINIFKELASLFNFLPSALNLT